LQEALALLEKWQRKSFDENNARRFDYAMTKKQTVLKSKATTARTTIAVQGARTQPEKHLARNPA
jgi:hypothetical protein